MINANMQQSLGATTPQLSDEEIQKQKGQQQQWLGMAPGTPPGGNPMFQPQLPQGGYHAVASPQMQQGPTNAQIWSPLVNRMAGVPHQAIEDRQTQSVNGQGLSTDQAWRGMFAHGANDLSPGQLRQSQGSTALNQFADPMHFQGSAPSGQTREEGAIAAGPEQQQVQYGSAPGSPGAPASAADYLGFYGGGMGKHNVQPPGAGAGMFSNSAPQAPAATTQPAPQGSQGPSMEGFHTSPQTPSPMFQFGTHNMGQVGGNARPAETNPTPELFGPGMTGLPIGEEQQANKANAAGAAGLVEGDRQAKAQQAVQQQEALKRHLSTQAIQQRRQQEIQDSMNRFRGVGAGA